MKRDILHINIANFYIAVAQVMTPKLRSYPVAIATLGSNRRTLLDVSLSAREAGLRKGMLLETAQRKCCDLKVLDPTPYAYSKACKALLLEAGRLSPRVELAGPGNLFVDLSGTSRLLGRSIDVAEKFHKQVQVKYNLDNAAGLGTSKLISKVATRVIKPKGLVTICEGSEESFIAPLPIGYLPGIDHKVIKQLMQFNLRYIKEIQCVNRNALYQVIGKIAFDVYQFCKGIDSVPVQKKKARSPSITERKVLNEQTNDDQVILKKILLLVCRAGVQLRRRGFAAGRLNLNLTFYDGQQVSQGVTLPYPLNGDLSLFDCFRRLFETIYVRRIRLSSMEIKLKNLTYPYGQLDLFENNAKEDGLMGIIDSLKGKFGDGCIGFAGLPDKI